VEATASAVRVADLELATQKFLRQEEAVGPWQVELAEARRDTERAKLATAQAEAARAAADVEEATVLLRRTEKDFELRFAEHLRIGTAEASLLTARAVVEKAEADLADARLRLERMTVRSPADGIVLTREAQPGSVVGPSTSATPVCTLYDPTKLRVRVDVPQGTVAGASAGQKARIRCDVRRGRPYQGTVLRIVEIADIQKVTVEVQVRVDDPDGLLKPDVLCTVAVIGQNSSQASSPQAVTVRIPAACLAAANAVWVVDGDTGRATRRTIRTGPRDGDHILVLEGLNATDKVIASNLEKLEDGTLVQVEGKR